VSITLLYGCCQIETTARDLDAVRRFMIDVLGAGPIEQPLAKQIGALFPAGQYDVDHLDCGEAVFQINQPSASMTYNGRKSVHWAYLERHGPCVTNLNFFVDDHAHARELLAANGAEVHIEGPSSASKALADYGPDNSRPGADDRPFLFMGSRHLIGFDLEIMEPNFLHFTRQSVQYPAFVQPRPRTGDGNLLLQRLVVGVSDIDRVADKLTSLFAPASRSRPYAVRVGKLGRAFRVHLGGIEIEYCEPLADGGELAESLSRYGEGVIAIAFAARDPERVTRRCRDIVDNDFDLLGCDDKPAAQRIRCRDILGFDVVIEERKERND
jgi:hypothetical protein